MNDEEMKSGESQFKNNDDKKYEEVCYLCRRSESRAGKMLHIPGNICLCSSCLQKTFDMMAQSGRMPSFDIPDFDPSTMDLSKIDFSKIDPSKTGQVYKDITKQEREKSATNKDVIASKENGKESEEPSKEEPKKEEQKTEQSKTGFGPLGFNPLMGFFMPQDIPQNQKLKKKPKKAKESMETTFDINKIPAPHMIKSKLDEYVVGQEHAKKVVSVAVYNHYKRVKHLEHIGEKDSFVEIEKSNMLMIGPTGCGKTYLVQTLARLLNVPLAITDATSLTEAGYIGDDVESVISKLLSAADNDVERAEHGIVFIDEIDKIAKKRNTNSRDVSGESVQQGLLKLLEGSEVEVPVGASSKNAMVPMTTIDTKNILFICGGAFSELEGIIKTRLNKSSSIGFSADLKDKYDNDPSILKKVTIEDLREFGMVPEFLGRLPMVFALEGLSKNLLVDILSKPKNAIIKQYQKLLAMDEVELIFDQSALEAVADRALEKKLGARALRAILEEFMLDIMYEIPKDESIGRVTITRDYIEQKGAPFIEMRGTTKVALQ